VHRIFDQFFLLNNLLIEIFGNFENCYFVGEDVKDKHTRSLRIECPLKEAEHSIEMIMATSIFEISLKFPLEENSFEYLNIKLNGNLNNKEKHFLYHFPSVGGRRDVGERGASLHSYNKGHHSSEIIKYTEWNLN
jgi:hypothetical protein